MTFADPILLARPARSCRSRSSCTASSSAGAARYAVRFTNVDLLGNLVPRTPAWRRHVPPALYLGAMAALVLALARPSMAVQVPREEATIILTMDVSGSMMATDVSPTRLAAAQKAANDFVDQLPAGVKVGLVAFSTAPRIVVAPTTDRAAVHAGHRRPPGPRRDRPRRRDHDLARGRRARSGVGRDRRRRPRRRPTRIASAARRRRQRRHRRPALGRPRLDRGAGRRDRPPLRRRELDRRDGAARRRPSWPRRSASRSTRSPSARADGVVTVPDDLGQLHTLNVPPDTETLAAIAETTGGRAFEAPTAAGPRPDLRQPRLADRLHDRGARGHPVVRRGGPPPRRRRRRPRRPLVQPLPMSPIVHAIQRGATPPHSTPAAMGRRGPLGAVPPPSRGHLVAVQTRCSEVPMPER